LLYILIARTSPTIRIRLPILANTPTVIEIGSLLLISGIGGACASRAYLAVDVADALADELAENVGIALLEAVLEDVADDVTLLVGVVVLEEVADDVALLEEVADDVVVLEEVADDVVVLEEVADDVALLEEVADDVVVLEEVADDVALLLDVAVLEDVNVGMAELLTYADPLGLGL